MHGRAHAAEVYPADLCRAVVLGAEDPVWPCAAALPMGWTWSLYFAEAANVYRMSLLPELAASRLLCDRGPPAVLDGRHRCFHYVYVDNLGVLSEGETTTSAALEGCVRSFNKVGLSIHEV